MFSPEGFVSLYELAEEFRKKGVGQDQFISHCSQIEKVAICSSSMQAIRISVDLLHTVMWDEKNVFAFIDTGRWVVSLHLVREAAGSFTPELFAGSRILLNTDPNGDFAYPFPPEFVDGLQPFEGQQIILPESEADKLRIVLENIRAKPRFKKSSLKADVERDYQDWLNSFPGRNPTETERDAWYKSYEIPRERERALWKKFKPEGGSKPGPRPRIAPRE